MSESLDRLESVFAAVVREPSPADRAAYLDRACADDPALRQRVEALLRAQEAAGSFLQAPHASPAVTVDDQSSGEDPGTTIGPYKLLEKIGEGGFGIVYLAEQSEPVRRKVALKILKPGMDTRQVVARFEAERQALAIMDHPNIAKVFDGGATPSGRPYFVMELVKGVPITQYCDQNHLTPRQRLELFVPVCQAVQHAHQKGIIHRDLKPSNVLVARHDTTPTVKVIDFGVAKALGQSLTDKTLFTGLAQMIGTPLYMSPEQAGMSDLDVDTRSDIYSLGVLLYELLTGTTPHSRDRFKKAAYDEIRRIIREEDPPRPSTRLSESKESLPSISAQRQTEPEKLSKLLRGELDWIVMKALEKDRNRRYETATGFALDVQRYLADEPVQACPPSTGYRVRKFARRHKRAVGAIAAVAAVLLLATGVSSALALWAVRAERLAETRLESETAERERAEAAVRDAKLKLYQSNLAQARFSRLSGRVGQRYQSLDALAEAARLTKELGMDESHLMELRNEAIACLALPDVRRVREVPAGLPGRGKAPAWAADGDLAVFARNDVEGKISVRSLVDNKELARLSGGVNGGMAFSFSPGSEFLAVCYQDLLPGQPTNFQVWDWRRTKVVFQPDFAVHEEAVRFSPDGRRLALGRETGLVTIHELATGKEVLRLQSDLKPTHLAFRPDGTQLALSSRSSSEVRVHETATGRLAATLRHPDAVMGIDWHPDKALIATACHDYRVYLWDVPAARRRAVLTGHRSIVYKVWFSPAGDLLLSKASDGFTRLWDPWTGHQLLALPGGLEGFSRDGQRLVGRDRHSNIVLWEVAPRREFRTTEAAGLSQYGSPGEAQVSPDGRWLAAPVGGAVQLWELAAAQGKAFLAAPVATATAFHPGGGELFVAETGGLFSWPIRPGEAGTLRVGPPRKLLDGNTLTAVSVDRAGRLLAVADRRGGWMLDLDRRSDPPRRFDHPNAFFVAVSPDGRWVASGAFPPSTNPTAMKRVAVKVWEARSGKLELDLPISASGAAIVAFSPDGRWLIAGRSHGGFSFWEVGAWKRARDFPRVGGLPAMSSSANGKLLALKSAVDLVHLMDADTGGSLAAVQTPQFDNLSWVALTPDGGRLVAGIMGQGCVGIWDLRAIRDRLRPLGLDWPLPPYEPAAPPAPAVPRVVVEDPRAEERQKAMQHARAGRWAEAMAALDPRDDANWFPDAAPDVACLTLLVGDGKRYRDLCTRLAHRAETRPTASHDRYDAARVGTLVADSPAEAAKLVRWAETLAGAERSAWRLELLGRAYFRAGQFDQAERSCRESLQVEPNWPGRMLNWLVLALACDRRGQRDEAKTWLAKATQWRDGLAAVGDKTAIDYPKNLGLTDWLEFHVLLAEARAALRGPPAKK